MNDRGIDDGWLVLLIQTRLMFPVFVLMRTGTEIEYEIPNSKREAADALLLSKSRWIGRVSS